MNMSTQTSANIGFVFSRGWAMPQNFFAPLQTELLRRYPGASMQTLDACDWSPARQWFGIGHSFGFVQLLRTPANWRGLVSLCGFTHFSATAGLAGVPPQSLQALRTNVENDRETALRHFYRQCNLPLRPSDIPPLQSLLQGLDDLATCRESLNAPVFALAAANDAIVPPELTQASFPAQEICWHPTAGHALGWQEADWCAERISTWLTHQLLAQEAAV